MTARPWTPDERAAVEWLAKHNRKGDVKYPGARICRYFRTMWRIHYGRIDEDGRGAAATCEFATADREEAMAAHALIKANPHPFYYVEDPIEPDPAYKCSWCPSYYGRPHCPPGRDPRTPLERIREAMGLIR